MSSSVVSTQTLGLVLAAAAAWSSSTGLALQRFAKVKTADNKAQDATSGAYKKLEYAGVLMNIGAQPLNIVALTFCSASIASGLGSSINILNSIFISRLQGNPFTKDMFLSMLCGIVGAVGLIACAPDVSKEMRSQEISRMMSFWQHWRLLLHLSALVLTALGCAFHIFHSTKKRSYKYSAYAYPILAAVMARFSTMSFRLLGQVIANGEQTENLSRFLIVLACAVCFGPGSVVSVSYCARQVDAQIFLPASVAFGNILGAAYGLSVGEFDNEPLSNVITFGFFVAITLGSVYFSSRSNLTPARQAAEISKKQN